MSKFGNLRPRIQKNAKPIYAFVNPSTLRSLEELNRHQISLPSELQLDCLNREARYVTCENLQVMSTLALLRIQARETRAWYKIIWEVQQDIQHQDCKFETPEGDDETQSRSLNLRVYVAYHVERIRIMKVQIKCSLKAQTRIDFFQEQGEFRYKESLQTTKQVTQELERCEEGTNSTRRTLGNPPDSMPPKNGGPASFTPSRPQYLLQFPKDIVLIDREFDVENLAICKPTVKEKINCEIVNDYAQTIWLELTLHEINSTKFRKKSARSKCWWRSPMQILPDSAKKCTIMLGAQTLIQIVKMRLINLASTFSRARSK